MKVKELMTQKPACATPDMELSKVAKMMDDYKIGSIPVVENKDNMKVVGVVTDRDIATRAVAQGKKSAANEGHGYHVDPGGNGQAG